METVRGQVKGEYVSDQIKQKILLRCLFNFSRYRTVLGHGSGVNVSLQLWGICKIAAHEHLACSVFESPWFRGKLASEFDTGTPQLLTHYRVYCSKLISCSKISRFRRLQTRMHISFRNMNISSYTSHCSLWQALRSQHKASFMLDLKLPQKVFRLAVQLKLIQFGTTGTVVLWIFLSPVCLILQNREAGEQHPVRQSGRGGEQQPEGWCSLGPVFPVRGQTSRCHQSSPGTEARHISFQRFLLIRCCGGLGYSSSMKGVLVFRFLNLIGGNQISKRNKII